MSEYILGLDCGTTASKVAIFDLRGRMLSVSTQEYQLLTPSPLEVEIDPEHFWQAFVKGTHEALAQAAINPAQIRAFSLSAQGETMVLLDASGKPLRRAISWMDNRAQSEADAINRVFGDAIYPTTGQVSAVPTWPAAKLLWIRKHEPDVFGRIHRVLLIEDYLLWRLTGEIACEGSLVCSTLYWDINSEQWWGDMLEFLELPSTSLPELRHSGSPIGHILPEAARELGLADDVVVSMGALDQVCGSIGVGNVRTGIFSENTGAALAICVLQQPGKPVFDPGRQMPVHYHGLPGRYMFHTFTTGGMVYRWFRDQFCAEEMAEAESRGVDAYQLVTDAAGHVSAGSDGLLMLPHLQGAMAPETNPHAKGVFFGVTLSHGKSHFARSILEAIAFTVRRNLEVIERIGGDVDEIRVLGGGAKSDLWNQIKADVTGKRIVKTESEEAACLGAAIFAGHGAGFFSSVEAAAEQMLVVNRAYEPDPDVRGTYDAAYSRYVALYESLVDVFAIDVSAR